MDDDLMTARCDGLARIATAGSHPENPREITIVLEGAVADRLSEWAETVWPGKGVTPGGVVDCAIEVLAMFLRGDI